MIKNSLILKINTNNLIKNYNFFKKQNKKLIVAPTIKANAYGLGSRYIFNLLKYHQCKHFFVATIQEGIELKNKNSKIKVYVLNGIQDYKLNLFKKYKLIPIINSIFELKRIIKSNLIFGIHIDTGINRLGIDFNDLPNFIYKNKNIEIILSHLASADKKNNKYNSIQLKRFIKVTNQFKNYKVLFSLANSNGSVLSKSYLFDMIRPGISLYGGNNKNELLNRKIKPIIKLSGKIIQIKEINKNEYIGYNQTFRTNKKIKVAILGVGYADGIPRKLSNKGLVFYKKERYKILGRISMDSLTIDISKSKHNLKIGTFIDLINYQNGIENFANQCETISNEVITSIGSRAKIIYE